MYGVGTGGEIALEVLYGLVAALITAPFAVWAERRIGSGTLATLVLFIPALVFLGVVMVTWELS